MFKSNLVTYPQTGNEDTYGQNLGRAARAFLGALLAVKPAKREVKLAEKEISPKVRAASIRKLYQLAASYDSISPNLAAELRQIAGRD